MSSLIQSYILGMGAFTSGEVSSYRRMNLPSYILAYSSQNMMGSALPRCRGPSGLGANLVRTSSNRSTFSSGGRTFSSSSFFLTSRSSGHLSWSTSCWRSRGHELTSSTTSSTMESTSLVFNLSSGDSPMILLITGPFWALPSWKAAFWTAYFNAAALISSEPIFLSPFSATKLVADTLTDVVEV